MDFLDFTRVEEYYEFDIFWQILLKYYYIFILIIRYNSI